MIIYKIDILKLLKEKGYSQYYLMNNGIIGKGAIENMRKDGDISLKTLDKVCKLTGLQPGDILAYKEEDVYYDEYV